MKRTLLTASILLFFLSGYCLASAFLVKKERLFSQRINETPVKKIVKKIAKANIFVVTPLNSKNVSEQELNYRDLLKTASIEELTQLAAEDKSAVVRLYAFRALMESVKDVPQNIFTQFRNDSTAINVIDGTRAETKPLNSIANGFLY
jgi:hypothetical protein